MSIDPAVPAAEPKSKVAPFIALIVGSTTLAFGPMLVRLADVSSLSSAFWRVTLALPVLVIFAALMRRRENAPPALSALPWLLMAIGGMFFAADLATWHMGIARTTLANSTLFGNSAAFILAGWALITHREEPKKSRLLALGLAFVGTIVLLGASAELSSKNLAGDLLCLFAGVAYTGYLVAMLRTRGKYSTMTLLTMSTLFSALSLLPIAYFSPGAFWPSDWTPLLILAISSQLLGQGLLVYATGSLSPTVIGVGLLVQPVVSASLGWAFFNEVMTPVEIAGAIMVSAALVLVRR